MTKMAMMELTLSNKFIPGTNLQGDLACADWRFLLPALSVQNTLIIGIPDRRELVVLSRISRSIVIVSDNKDLLEKNENISDPKIRNNVKKVHLNKMEMIPLDRQSVDFVYIVNSDQSGVIVNNTAFIEELKRLLDPQGAIYFESKGLRQRIKYLACLKKFAAQDLEQIGHFWLTPFSGDLQTAVPLDKKSISTYFFNNVFYGRKKITRVVSRIGIILSKIGSLKYVMPRQAFLVRSANRINPKVMVPDYLVTIGQEADTDISGLNYGFSARGRANSNKVIFFLFNNNSESPNAVTKMTRSAEFNARLANEYLMLSELERNGQIDKGSYPQPLFFKEQDSTAILGLKAIIGKPFRVRTLATVDCPFLRDAIDWLVNLGSATSKGMTTTRSDASKILFKLFIRLTEIYSLTDDEKAFLTEVLSFDNDFSGSFPLVLQHGDPGTWNMMVTDEDKVIVIDWEAGEKRGMPLWDIFYFIQTYGSWMGRKQGNRDSLSNFEKTFFERSSLNSLFTSTVGRYCENINLDKSLVEPLFFGCWIHRALKEAARLPLDNVNSGTFIKYLRQSIANRQSIGLNRLFSKDILL
jgi:hypothetical protein